MTSRMSIPLDGAERAALTRLAEQELRDPRAQLRRILRQELLRLGFLPADDDSALQSESDMERRREIAARED